MNAALVFLAVGNVVVAFAMVAMLLAISSDMPASPIRRVYNAQLACLGVAIFCFFVVACGWFE